MTFGIGTVRVSGSGFNQTVFTHAIGLCLLFTARRAATPPMPEAEGTSVKTPLYSV